MTVRILILEDDKLFNETLQDFLEEEGYVPDAVMDPYSALDLTYDNKYDIYLFDVNLPYESGFDLLDKLRSAGDMTPTIFLTSREDKESLAEGFGLGADDYMKKPIDFDELQLRIDALLRRQTRTQCIEIGEYTLDVKNKTLFYQEEEVELTIKVIELLMLFVQSKGDIVTNTFIKEQLWTANQMPSDGSIRVYVTQLKKLFPEHISNIRGSDTGLRVRMHKRVIWGTVIYVISIGFFLGFIYRMLNTWDDFVQIYLWVSLILLLFAGMFGYIFVSTLLAQQKRIDENLSQLSREILHELNIPLATIQANTKLIARKLDDQKSLERIARIETSSKRLKRLYRELVYSIKKEFQPIEKEVFDLKNVLEERVEVFEAFDRNAFVLEIGSYRVTADKIGFEKAIDNILMNAMKYSSRETPVTLHLIQDTLNITDQGVGMSETELLKIYERYYQADHSKEGEGIGLALVKSYCDSEGIDIQIKSQKNVGTTVFLDLKKISSH